MSKIKNALISVSNKEKLKSVLDVLKKNQINIISSGGTYKSIKKLGFKCKEVSQFTGFEEMLDGRVKTLHPKIAGGILATTSTNDENVSGVSIEVENDADNEADITPVAPLALTIILPSLVSLLDTALA